MALEKFEQRLTFLNIELQIKMYTVCYDFAHTHTRQRVLLKSVLKIVITYKMVIHWISTIHWALMATSAHKYTWDRERGKEHTYKKSFEKYVINLFNHVHVLLWSIVKLFICYDEAKCMMRANGAALHFIVEEVRYHFMPARICFMADNDKNYMAFFSKTEQNCSLFFFFLSVSLSHSLQSIKSMKIFAVIFTVLIVNLAILIWIFAVIMMNFIKFYFNEKLWHTLKMNIIRKFTGLMLNFTEISNIDLNIVASFLCVCAFAIKVKKKGFLNHIEIIGISHWCCYAFSDKM